MRAMTPRTAGRCVLACLRRPRRRRKPVPSARGTAALRSGKIRPGNGDRASSGGAAFAVQARALSDPDPAVRALALRIVAEFSKRHAAPQVAAALFDIEPSVRAVAAGCAARVGSSVAPALLAALDDREADVRNAAARALGVLLDTSTDSAAELRRRWVELRLAELRRVQS